MTQSHGFEGSEQKEKKNPVRTQSVCDCKNGAVFEFFTCNVS